MILEQKYRTEKRTDANGYSYTAVLNDENKVRTYTLENGLTIYLAQNFDAPRIQTYLAVRTGSNNDPKDNTGLAHYLEHMMFKGTSKIGTQDWAKEAELLTRISELYEQHKAEDHPEKKKELYREIDEVSQEASSYAIANEYDKCISALGATGTNAHTWLDETVYKNNIPSNELARWLKIERERISEVVLRLFHTELESVYEEFNRAQDNDARLVNYALMELLFPRHPNGQQTTLGNPEHLKNPSMKAIHQYFAQYYVPNNCALVLVGDLDFEETIQLIDRYFGSLEYRAVPDKPEILEEPLTGVVSKTVKSPTIPRIQIAWRTDRYGTREALLADLVSHILTNNGEAGLLDLNVNNAQKALFSSAFSMAFNEYGYFSAVIVPKEEQTLDEAKGLILNEIEKVKNGDFPDWLLPAIINDFKVQRLKGLETADGLATNLYQTYIRKQTWLEELEEMDRYAEISKADVVQFAREFFKDNYVAVYKEQGSNDQLVLVDNPGITPIQINREARSPFLMEILAEESPEITPEFIDYHREITVTEVKGKKLSFVANKDNRLAQLHYIFPFGSDHDRELSLAAQVLQYLGTDKFTPDDLKQEFYKIGISHDFKTSPDRLTISLTGLEENMGKGMELLHHWVQEAMPDREVYGEYVKTVLESREAAKKDKGRISAALQTYAKFGPYSRSRDVLSQERLEAIQCEALTGKMKEVFLFPYEIFYYGNELDRLSGEVASFIEPEKLEIPERRIYPEPDTSGKVFFVDYEMVQTEMSRIGKGPHVRTADFGKINVFNEYFGSGLSSIVFQELRESKSLAYSAYAVYQAAAEIQHPDYITTYIGTQPDKLGVAVDSLEVLMEDLPQFGTQFHNARNTAIKQLASGRITRTNIFFNHLRLKKLGVDYDLRRDMYREVSDLTLAQLTAFYNERIKPVQYNVAILGKRETLDRAVLERMGEFTELSLEEVFGF